MCFVCEAVFTTNMLVALNWKSSAGWVLVSIGVVREQQPSSAVGGLQSCCQPWHSNCWTSSILSGADRHLLSPLLHHQLISQWKPPTAVSLNGWWRIDVWCGLKSHNYCHVMFTDIVNLKKNNTIWIFIRSKLLDTSMSCTVFQLGISSHCSGTASEREQKLEVAL